MNEDQPAYTRKTKARSLIKSAAWWYVFRQTGSMCALSLSTYWAKQAGR